MMILRIAAAFILAGHNQLLLVISVAAAATADQDGDIDAEDFINKDKVRKIYCIVLKSNVTDAISLTANCSPLGIFTISF